MLKSQKRKSAIDLDNWREPRWARAKALIAAGYPTGHKQRLTVQGEDSVVSELVLATADVEDPLDRHGRLICAKTRMDYPLERHLSGMSGGPIYIIQDDDHLVSAGIIFEGWPGARHETHSALDMHDLVFRGLTLTPSNFEGWLRAAKML